MWHLGEVSYGNSTQAGAFVLGMPWIMIGQTSNIAMGLTAMHSDTIDLYQEILVRNGTHYMFDGKEVPVKTRREIIKIRDPFAKSGFRHEILIVNATHHGPLIHDKFNKGYDFMKRLPYDGLGQQDIAFSWSGFQGVSEYYSTARCVSKAKDVHQAIE